MAQQYTLPQLTFAYDALEPVLSKELIEIHYTKHHAAYVTNLNKALSELETAEKNKDLVKEIALQGSMTFNGGGHINHSLYWENLRPTNDDGGSLAPGPLFEALTKEFSSLEKMQEKFSQKACSIQGSGWAWLGFHAERGHLEIETTQNHDLLLATKGLHPLLCIDMWEHAFYLSYKNVKTEYMKKIWSLINWSTVESRYKKALS